MVFNFLVVRYYKKVRNKGSSYVMLKRQGKFESCSTMQGTPKPIGFDNNYRWFDAVVWRGKLGGYVK